MHLSLLYEPSLTLTLKINKTRMYNIKVVFWELCTWHKIFVYVLTTTIGLDISCVAPLASSFIHDWTPYLKHTKEHPMIPNFIEPPHWKSLVYVPSTLEFFKEWQKSLAFILDENGGLRDQNIVATLYLWRAKTKGGTRVSWLCKKHYEEQMSLSLS